MNNLKKFPLHWMLFLGILLITEFFVIRFEKQNYFALLIWFSLVGIYISSLRVRIILSYIFNLIDKQPIHFLITFQVLYLIWCAAVLFSNPYTYQIQHGDAVFFTQTLWNMTHGLLPESSFFSTNGALFTGDPRLLSNSVGYVSIFTLHQYWLPLLLLTPIYALYPEPPTVLFALNFYVVTLGTAGVYWASLNLGAKKGDAVLIAVLYVLIPQISISLFFKGYFDVLAFGVMPWLLGAILCRKRFASYFFAVLVSAISFPYTYFVCFCGVVAFLFLNSRLSGIMLLIIGFAMMKFDTLIFEQMTASYFSLGNIPPSFLKAYVLDRTIGSLISPFKAILIYLLYLFLLVGFFPLYVIYRNRKCNLLVIGLLVLVCLASIISLFRSYGWEFQRNSILIIPVYLSAIIAYIELQNDNFFSLSIKSLSKDRVNLTRVIFFSGLISAMLCLTPYLSGPLASHLPWGSNGIITASLNTKKWQWTLDEFNRTVPRNAQVAYLADPEVQAYIFNRQHAWVIGGEPKGVRYYVLIGDSLSPADRLSWDLAIMALKKSNRYLLIFDGNPGKRLLIYENLDYQTIQRDDSKIGWPNWNDIFFR